MAARITPEQSRRAFQEAALPYLPDLYRLASRMCRGTRDAEDLVQETFLRAFTAWETFVPGSGVRPWLFRILMNAYINGYRRSRCAARAPDECVAAATYSPSARQAAEDPEDALFDGFLCDEVAGAIARLPEAFRLVVLLCDVEGFRYQEIAEIVGCPIGTVMSRLSRARKQLQAALADVASERGIGARRQVLAA